MKDFYISKWHLIYYQGYTTFYNLYLRCLNFAHVCNVVSTDSTYCRHGKAVWQLITYQGL